MGRSTPVTSASEAVIADYLRFLQASGLARASVARAMAAISGLYRFLTTEGSIESDPLAGIEKPGVPLGLPKALSEEEVFSLLEGPTRALPTRPSADLPRVLRDRAMLEVLYGCGLRISELVGLSLEDVAELVGASPPTTASQHVPPPLLKVFGKGSKERLVPMGRCSQDALAAWLSPEGRPRLMPARWARRGDAEALFLNARGQRITRQGAWLIVKAWGEEAGLAGKLSPHVLRHSCATHMLDHGADIRVVQEFLGHASISTTQIYTRVSTARLRAVYDAAHPRSRALPATLRG